MSEMAMRRRSGFWNLLARENRMWWGTRRWLMQTLVGVVGVNGLLAIILFVLPDMAAAAGEPIEPIEAGVQLLMGLGAFVLAIDTIILTQDTIIGEKESGVAEWVLSKPVSRQAYVWAKLVANALGVLVTLVIVPGAVAYGLLSLAVGEPYPAVAFLSGMGVLALHTLFYLALSLMMGVLVTSRGPLLAITLGSVLGGAVAIEFAPSVSLVTPWLLPNIAGALALDVPLPADLSLPIGATAVLTLVALAVALWRFQRAEL